MDKREDTGNYYPGGTVVTGTPVPAPGGGTSVEVVSPSPDGAGKAADAKAVYDRFYAVYAGIDENRESVSQFASSFIQLLYQKQDALNDGQMAAVNSGVTENWRCSKDLEISNLEESCDSQYEMIEGKIPLYINLSPVEVDGSIHLYPFSRNEVSATLEAMTIAEVIRHTSDGSVSFGSDIMLDCSLVIDCRGRETAPKITWGAIFYPRTDAETDFACVAGVRNVYWITEYAPNEFCVAGWQQTDGGGTSNGGNAQ